MILILIKKSFKKSKVNVIYIKTILITLPIPKVKHYLYYKTNLMI